MASERKDNKTFRQQNMMKFRTEKDENNLIIFIEGYMTPVTVPKLQEYLTPDVLEDVTHLVFDLSNLEYMSSYGLRVFLSSQKAMEKKGGNMVVRGISPLIMELFEMTGFHKILSIEE